LSAEMNEVEIRNCARFGQKKILKTKKRKERT